MHKPFVTALGRHESIGLIILDAEDFRNVDYCTKNVFSWKADFLVDTWLTEFWIDRICMVLQKGYVLYV